MYFGSTEEQKYVQRGLLPEARRQPVADDLRGWSWAKPPLKPIYSEPLGVYEVAGKYCPTGRDVFLRRAQGVATITTWGMREGRLFHQLVATMVTEAKKLIYQHGAGCVVHLERLFQQPLPDPRANGLTPDEQHAIDAKMMALRAFEARRIVERIESVLARYPYVRADALATLALPVSVELKLDGRYLGLSDQLAADAIGFPDLMVLDLKFGDREPFHRLTTTGYALVLESVWERPVDVGCIVYGRFVDGRVVIERDYHIIDDELRQMFVEERDERMRSVAEELDPGLPGRCPSTCGYLRTCHPPERGRQDAAQSTIVANLQPREAEPALAAP